MTAELNPLASQHVPYFVTSPGETDQMMWMVGIFLIGLVMLAGVIYFKLHALPEHLSHGRASKTQIEIVGVLALLALFTHNSMFWVIALILAFSPWWSRRFGLGPFERLWRAGARLSG